MECSRGPDNSIVLRVSHGTYVLHGSELRNADGVTVAQLPPDIVTLIYETMRLQERARTRGPDPLVREGPTRTQEILDAMTPADRASNERRFEILRAELRKRFEAERNDRTPPSV